MKQYSVTGIEYDTDGADVELPTEMVISLDDDADPGEHLADAITEKTGWLVKSYEAEPVDSAEAAATEAPASSTARRPR